MDFHNKFAGHVFFWVNNLLDTHWNETCECALNLRAGGRKLFRAKEAFFRRCYFERGNKTPQQMDGNENCEGFLLDIFSVRRIYLFWACFSIYFQWIWIHDSHIAHLQHKIVFIFTQRRVQCERLWKPTLTMDVKQPSGTLFDACLFLSHTSSSQSTMQRQSPLV